jgi:hypothetical protein
VFETLIDMSFTSSLRVVPSVLRRSALSSTPSLRRFSSASASVDDSSHLGSNLNISSHMHHFKKTAKYYNERAGYPVVVCLMFACGAGIYMASRKMSAVMGERETLRDMSRDKSTSAHYIKY